MATTATSAARLIDPKKRPPVLSDREPMEGITGMSYDTQRHFVIVKQKIADYVDEQQALEYDAKHLPVRPHHHHHDHHASHVLFVDGKKVPTKTHSSSSIPKSSAKHLKHNGGSSSHIAHHNGRHTSSNTPK